METNQLPTDTLAEARDLVALVRNGVLVPPKQMAAIIEKLLKIIEG